MPLVSRREAAIWAAGFAGAALLLIATGFASDDPDSALYAALSARLAEGPFSHWIAPEWWGHWDSEGWFREHPAGVFIVPTLLGALGIPGVQPAYIVGMAAAAGALLLIAHLVKGVTSLEDARAVLVLLQLIPLASVFRIRANHEYPMLMCLLVALIGADAVRRSWGWVWLTPIALVIGLMIKGVFVLVPIIAVVIWIFLNPRAISGTVWRPLSSLALGVAAMGLSAAGYDAAYQHVTGESFWAPYWARQLAPLTIATPLDDGSSLLHHARFYAARVLWHPAPWSWALVAAAWMHRDRLAPLLSESRRRDVRGLMFALAAAALTIAMLVPSSRFAERYIFAANYLIATAGIVVALRTWPALARRIEYLDQRVPALPALVWMGLIALRLAVGPFLPRISG